MDFLKKIQAHWLLLIFFCGFLGKIFGFYDNFANLWNTPKTIQEIKNQTNSTQKQLCGSIALQKTIIISNASVFNAFLMAQDNKDTKSIEIIKEMAKTQIQTQTEKLKQLIEQCND